MEPRRAKYPLGSLSRIEAKAHGEPGHRTFVLALEAGRASCSLWLEKEQLFQLAVHLQTALRGPRSKMLERPSHPVEPERSVGDLTIEFKARQFLLRHDPESNAFGLEAYELEDPEEGEAGVSVSFWITPGQAAVVAEEALEVCAAGRPNCFLCGLPMNPEGHVCPRSNGHTVLGTG